MFPALGKLWAECAREAAQAVVRSPLALVALVLIAPVLALVNLKLAAHLGLFGGILMGLLQALAAGWYLALVDIAVNGRRRVDFQDVYDQLGSYVSEVISVMFVFYLVGLVLSLIAVGAGGAVVLLLVPALAIAFNPTPEMIALERDTGTDLLRTAWQFVRENGPEWLIPQLFATIVTGVLHFAFTGERPGIEQVVEVLTTFGPFFGFIHAGGFATPIGGGSTLGFLGGIAGVALVHTFMVFRAVLYKKLRGTNRRGRAWADRARR